MTSTRHDSKQPHKSGHKPGATVPFAEAVRVWLRIGLLSFGGPAGQIALMHQTIVDEKKWLGEGRFLHALNYCMLLPGPEAQQLATYVGWLLHGTVGGLVAGVLFILPGAVVILAISILYAAFQEVSVVQALFFGVKAAVFAVVVRAVIQVGRRVLKDRTAVAIAAAAFVAIFLFAVPFPMIVAGAAALGLLRTWRAPASGSAPADGDDGGDSIAMRNNGTPSLRRAAVTLFIGALLWAGPILLIAAWLGIDNVYAQEGLFFSKLAVVTFGGAYAVLAYMAQQAVETYGWLAPGEMLDGLGMAETTPGPLIMVVQFVGFMGAYRSPGTLDPLLAGTLGAVLTTWVTFVPCFLWIFLGAPYVERLRRNVKLSAALSAITAAVVGVILNLALWFGLHVLFAQHTLYGGFGLHLLVPDVGSLDPWALGLSAVAVVALFVVRLDMIKTLGLCAALGVAVSFVT